MHISSTLGFMKFTTVLLKARFSQTSPADGDLRDPPSCFYIKITCHNIPKAINKFSWAALLSQTLTLCELKRAPPECVFFLLLLPSTTGHIGELFADGHTLCSLLVKMPQATFGEALCRGNGLNWKLKEQWLLKPASGMMTHDDSSQPSLSTSSFNLQLDTF